MSEKLNNYYLYYIHYCHLYKTLNKKFDFLEADINDSKAYRDSIFGFDAVVNFAAESHVDRSIINPNEFFMTNSVGVATLTRTCM